MSQPVKKVAYSSAENERLRQLYPVATKEELQAAFPGRSLGAIARQGAKLGAVRAHHMPTEWSAADLDMVRAHYPAGGSGAVQPHLSRYRKPAAIHKKARRLGVAFGRDEHVARAFYTDEERERLRASYLVLPAAELLAAFPGRTLKALSKEARALGLPRRSIHWPTADLEYVRSHYAAEGPAVVGQALGRPARQVSLKAHALGLRFRQPGAPKAPRKPRPRVERKPRQRTAKQLLADARREARAAKLLAPKPAKVVKPKPVKVVAMKPPKPAPQAKPLPLTGIQDNSRTPLLNTLKATRQREAAKLEKAADWLNDMKKLPGAHPARIAFTIGSRDGLAAGKAAYFNALKQAA